MLSSKKQRKGPQTDHVSLNLWAKDGSMSPDIPEETLLEIQLFLLRATLRLCFKIT